MSRQEPLLKVRLDGEVVGPGTIPVSHLIRFLSNLEKALYRTGRILSGASESAAQGRPTREIKDAVALDLVLLTHGSNAVVLGLERRLDPQLFPQIDFGQEVLEAAIAGLGVVQTEEEQRPLPAGYDSGVLMAWRDAGIVFDQGVEHIAFTLNHRRIAVTTRFTPAGYRSIQEKIKGPQTNIRTIEGRLLMADFKEHGTRCRVHPSVGEPVLCLFDEEQKDEVLENILQYVRIVGEAKEDPVSGKISSIKINDIERLEDREDFGAELLPQGTPLLQSFWETPSLEELAQSQHVEPLADVRALFGTWPGEDDDGFEASIDRLRHAGMRQEDGHE